MFLRSLLDRNPGFLQAAVELHQAGKIPANSYVLDLDAIEANTSVLCTRARTLDLTVYAMTKQIGRAAGAMAAMAAGGVDGFVAVDMACARPITRNGHRLGHLGHLVQVPRAEAGEAAAMAPDYWTVFSANKATEAAAAARANGRIQRLLLRVFDPGDTFYAGHEGGVPLRDLGSAVDVIAALDGAEFAGLTTFPAMLFDERRGSLAATRNVETLARAADLVRRHSACPAQLEMNLPGTTSTEVLGLLAESGATQVEPGHGLTGTTPLHAVRDLPEQPGVLYLSEVAHIHQGVPLCFGGGLYVDPVFGEYQVHAVVAHDAAEISTSPVPVDMPDPAAIDYYASLHPDSGHTVTEGATVIFGFRIQAFVTRALVTGLSGVSQGQPRVVGVWNGFGDRVEVSST
ncbi:alanine racemase [Candidatus Poriferisodalis sp.]|uniref:alanine racemase n=1 Tax=Candidatus Poriferisodalis sp. TaxID=3101277 RepID=UPI003AF7C867